MRLSDEAMAVTNIRDELEGLGIGTSGVEATIFVGQLDITLRLNTNPPVHISLVDIIRRLAADPLT